MKVELKTDLSSRMELLYLNESRNQSPTLLYNEILLSKRTTDSLVEMKSQLVHPSQVFGISRFQSLILHSDQVTEIWVKNLFRSASGVRPASGGQPTEGRW
jgi:hypothetical protein